MPMQFSDSGRLHRFYLLPCELQNLFEILDSTIVVTLRSPVSGEKLR
jgi:hypothetical protein